MISLYPIPRTLTMRIRSSLESLCRNLVMNTCRLRELKKLSFPPKIKQDILGIHYLITVFAQAFQNFGLAVESSCSIPVWDNICVTELKW